MPKFSDLIIDLGAKGAQKLLKVPLKNAASYYDTHISLLKDAYKALEKAKDVKAQSDKLDKNLYEIKRAAAELKSAIPKKPELPKKEDKSWGKSKKHSSYKDALKAYVTGITVAIVALEDYIKKAESTKKSHEDALAKFFNAAQDAKLQKGDWAKIGSIPNQHAMETILANEGATKKMIDKIVTEKKALLALYKKSLGPAMKAKSAAS